MYKEITISLKADLQNGDFSDIQLFNGSFRKSDIQIKTYDNNNNIKILLREVDFSRFKKICGTFSNSSIIQKVLSEVNSIKSYGISGKKRNYVDYNKERKVKGRKQKEEIRNKYYYANNNDFAKTENHIPSALQNQILCGDSETLLKKLPDNSIDIIFTSPPYNFGLDYNQNDKDASYWEQYFSKLFAIFQECIRTLKYGGRIIINIQPLFSDYIPSHQIISNFFIRQKLIWKGEILWEKNNYNCKYTAWGSWKSPSNPYLKYTWEFIEVFCKGDLKKPGSKENIDISADEFKNWVVAKWSIAPERNMKDFGHPAMFPEELVERVLKLFSYKGDIVLDPFSGVGTTAVVAKKLDRKYIGIDISDDYCKKARSRINDAMIIQELSFE